MSETDYQEARPTVGNGMAIAGFCTGLVGLLLSWTVFLGIILGILGITFGSQARDPLRGLALAGIILGVLAILVSIAMVVFPRRDDLRHTDQRRLEARVPPKLRLAGAGRGWVDFG